MPRLRPWPWGREQGPEPGRPAHARGPCTEPARGTPHLHVQDVARLEAVGAGGLLAAEGGQTGVGLVQEVLAPAGAGEVHVHAVQAEEDPPGVRPVGHSGAVTQEEAGRVDRTDGGALRGTRRGELGLPGSLPGGKAAPPTAPLPAHWARAALPPAGGVLTCSKPPSSRIQARGAAAGAPQLLLGVGSWGWAPAACTSAVASSHTDSRGRSATSRPVPLTRISRPPLCQDTS